MSAVLAAMLAQAAVAPEARPITEPVWDRRPAMAVASRHYPRALAEAGGGARAVVDCVAAPDGALSDCRIVADSRPGLGAGEAALKLATHYRLKPLDAKGEAVVGRRLRLATTLRAPTVHAKAEGGWEILQDPYAWESDYPDKALAAGIGGEATVECKGRKGAKKVICTVVAETPLGHGFGSAALALQKRILVRPPAAGGGIELRMTIVFRPQPAKAGD